MGSYTDQLYKGERERRIARQKEAMGEHLACCAILRDGECYYGERSHYRVRQAIGDKVPTSSNPNDIEGFWTSAGRFVTREEGNRIAFEAKQTRLSGGRKFLSSDVDWWPNQEKVA